MISLKKALYNTKNYSELKTITDGIDKNDIIITWYGSRRFKHKNFSDTVSYNDLLAVIENKASSSSNLAELKNVFTSIKLLNQKADQKLKSSNWLAKGLHFIPHLLGRLFFNRNKVLENINRQISRIADPAKSKQNKTKQKSKTNTDTQSSKTRVRRRRPPPPKPDGPTIPILDEVKYDEKRAKDELDFNFLQKDENLSALIVNPKLLFHIHAGKFGAGSPLEGVSVQAPLNFVLQYLKDQNSALNNPRLTSLISRLEDAHTLSLILPPGDERSSTDNSFEIALQKKIAEAFELQKQLLIPGGWKGTPAGHAMYYELIPSGQDKATLRVYDLGATVGEGQEKEITSTKVRYCPYKDIENISKEKLLDLNNLRAIREMRSNIVLLNSAYTNTQYDAKDILVGLLNVFAPEAAKISDVSHAKTPQRPMSPQEVGVCSFRSLMAFIATNLPRREYKKLKCDLKIKSLMLQHKNLISANNFNVENIALTRKSIKRTSKSIYELALQKILPNEYIKQAASTLKQISQNVPDVIEEGSGKVNFIWHELRSWDDISIPEVNLTQEIGSEKRSSFSITSNFDVVEEFNRLQSESNKVKAVSQAIELAENALHQGEQVGLKIGIENFILALPTDFNFWKENTPAGKERDLIVKIGQLSEAYFNACFYTPDASALSFEKHAAFTKILMIQENLVNLFNRDKIGNFGIGIPDISDMNFGPQHKAHEGVSTAYRYPQSPATEIFDYMSAGKEGSITKSFNAEKLKAFQKLFSDIPELKEKFEKFSRGAVPTLKKYIEFYASDQLPPWFQAVRNSFFAKSYLHDGNIETLRGGSEKPSMKFSCKDEKDDKVSINFNLENLQNINIKRSNIPRNLLMLRPINSGKLKNLFSLISGNYHQGEKEWLSQDVKTLGIDLSSEEYEEIRRIFGGSLLGPLETLDYFSKNIDKLTDPDYQTIFQLALLTAKLPDAFKKMPVLKDHSIELISRAYKQMKQADQTQPSIFLLQMLRYVEGFTNSQSSISRFNELKLFLKRKGVTSQEKSVIYSEIIAHLNEKRNGLEDEELELLLSGLLYLSRNRTPEKWADPYQMQAAAQAPHNLANQIKKFVSQPKFLNTAIHRIIQETLPTEEARNWSLAADTKIPIFQSNLDTYSPLDGFLFLDKEKVVKQQLPEVFLEDPDFIRLFENVKEATQVKPGIFSFTDAFGRETLIRYDYEKKAPLIEQKFGDEWRVYLPISSLIIMPRASILNDKPEHAKSRIESRYLANNFSAWALPNGEIILTSMKTGAVKYRVQKKTPDVTVERIKDNFLLGTPSNILKHFEDSSYVHQWYEPSESQQSRYSYSKNYPFKELELPRFNLSFNADLSSKEFPEFFLKPNSRLPIFNSYSRYLVLENNKGERKVIVACQNFLQPDKTNSLIPKYEVDQGLQLTNYSQQKYFIYDINQKGLLTSSSREANLYAAQIFTVVQQYDLASAHLKAYGSKLTPYTKEETDFLKQIASINQVTGDEDPQARALRTYASYLLIKNALTTSGDSLSNAFIGKAQENLLSYLQGIKGVSSLKIKPEEEIFLLKVILEKNFDPKLFLRLKELDPNSQAAIQNPQLSLFPSAPSRTTQISFKIPSENDLPSLLYQKISRPSLDRSLLTRFGVEVDNNFLGFYTLIKTATAEEKEWLKTAFIFNRGENNPKINFLEVLFKYPDKFEDIPLRTKEEENKFFSLYEWRRNQVSKAQELITDDYLVTLHKFPQDLPTLRLSAGKAIENKPLIKVAFDKTVKADALDPAKDFFTGSLETRDPAIFNEGKDKLNSWKNNNDTTNAELNRLSGDVEVLKKVPLRTRYDLKCSLDDVSEFLSPKDKSKSEENDLKQRELKILELANRKPDKNDREARLKFRLEAMADLRKPLTLEELIVNFGKQDTRYLQNRNPYLTADDLTKLYSQLCDYLLLATQEQKRTRALIVLKKLKGVGEGDEKDELIQELALELTSTRSFDPKENPLYLTFEYFLNIMIRKDQKDNKDKFTGIPNAVMEIIMGSGKTSVLLQLIGNYFADSKNLSMLVVPEPLFEQVASPTQRIHYDAFGKELSVLSFSRKSSFSKTSLEILLDQINTATKQQQCVITTNKSIACLVLKYVEMCLAQPVDAPRSEELRLMDKLIHKLSKTGYPLMDEIDTLLNILHEVSFSFGDLVPVEENEYVTISTLYKILYQNKEIKSLAYVESDPNPIKVLKEPKSDKVEGDSKSDKIVPVLTQENYHKTIKPKLAKAFIEELAKMRFESKVLENKVHQFYSSLTGTDRSLLESYLTQDANKLDEAQKYFDDLHPELQNIIALASEEISRFLPYTLTINSNEKYGYDDGGLFAIPYSAANRPNKGSDFKNSHITINTTFQLYIKDRIPKDVLINVIGKLRAKAQLELKDDPHLDIEHTKAWKSFNKIKGDIDISLLKYNEAQLSDLYEYINGDIELKIKFIVEGLLPYLKRYNQSAAFNAQNIVEFFTKVSGFTGTLWNTSTMLQKLNILPGLGTDAKTILTLLQKCKGPIFKVKSGSVSQMLDEMGTDFDLFTDAGGYFKDAGSAKVAKLIAKKSGVPTSFYSKKGIRKITDGIKKMPFKEQKRKVFLDQSRATGTDEKLPPTAKGVVTIGRNLLLRDLLQAVWRLRGIEKKQNVFFWVSEEVESIIRPVCGKKPEDPITFEDILQFSIYNQANQLGQDNFKALKQQLLNIPQMMVLKAMMSGKLTDQEEIEATKLLKLLWVKPANQEPRLLYGKLAKEKEAAKAVEEEKVRAVALIKRCFEALPSYRETPLEAYLNEVNDITNKLEKLLPPKLMNKDLDDDQSVEMEVEQEVEQEVEAEMEESKEQLDTALGLKAINTFSRITDFEDQDKKNYVSLNLFFKSQAKYEIYAEAFEGIDTSINVFQFAKEGYSNIDSSKKIPLSNLKFFGPYRTPLHHVGVRKDGTIMLLSHKDAEQPKKDEQGDLKLYNLTLGPIDPMEVSPKTFERIVKVKFLNGESNYSKKELEVLRAWIGEEEVATEMRDFFIKEVLSGLPQKKTAYNSGSDLQKLFRDLEIEQSTLAFNEEN